MAQRNTRVGVLRIVVGAATFALAVTAGTRNVAAERALAPFPAAAAAEPSVAVAHAASVFTEAAWENVAVGDIDPRVLALALHAAATAITKGDAVNPGTLTVIDFSRPSTAQRLWVFDLRSPGLLMQDVVSHGRGSGAALPRVFSNEPGSNASSLGLFRTGEAYAGHNGYSLRLDGLEHGVNDRARERAIVIHGAPYVSTSTMRVLGFLGRSQGCPAVRPEITRQLIDTVKGGGLLFAYYPDPKWLATSTYLN